VYRESSRRAKSRVLNPSSQRSSSTSDQQHTGAGAIPLLRILEMPTHSPLLLRKGENLFPPQRNHDSGSGAAIPDGGVFSGGGLRSCSGLLRPSRSINVSLAALRNAAAMMRSWTTTGTQGWAAKRLGSKGLSGSPATTPIRAQTNHMITCWLGATRTS
jgi:hypothetical protein